MRTPALVAALLSLLLMVVALSAGQASNAPPVVGPVKAVFDPPFTRYSVVASDPDADALTYVWTNTNVCGVFTGHGDSADWDHGESTNCTHDAPYHAGTITVSVSDGHGHDVSSSYFDGSLTGEGPTPATSPPCPARDVAGAFEPSQAVWQDDELFADMPGKELRAADARHAVAELDMVAGKATALFGVKGARDAINVHGLLAGARSEPTQVRFTLKDAAGERVVYTYDAGRLPVAGDCGESTDFNVTIPAPLGVPATGAFTFGAQGPYTITMELAQAGGGAITNSSVVVSGMARTVRGPTIAFVPIVLGPVEVPTKADLVAQAQRLAIETRVNAPDDLPLAPGNLATVARADVLDLSDAVDAARPGAPTSARSTGRASRAAARTR